MQTNVNDLLSYEESAREIGIALGSLKQAINRGSLHPIKVPRERRKFLRREEVQRYRDRKVADATSPTASALSTADAQTDAASMPSSSKGPQTQEPDQLRLLFVAAGIAWSTNAAELRKAAEAIQKAASDNAAAIRDTVISALQIYFAAAHGTESPLPQGIRGATSQKKEKTSDPSLQENTSEHVATLLHQMRASLAQSGSISAEDERVLQDAQALLARSASTDSLSLSSAIQEPVSNS